MSYQSGLKTSLKNLTTANIKVDDQQIINQSLFEVGSPSTWKRRVSDLNNTCHTGLCLFKLLHTSEDLHNVVIEMLEDFQFDNSCFKSKLFLLY